MTKTTEPKVFNSKIQYFLFMVTIIIIAAIGFFASDIYLPSLPAIAQYFHQSSLQVQLTMSVFLLTMAIFQVFIGALSDKFGRKRILFLSVLIFIIASLGCYNAQSLNELILFRFFQGMGAACGMSIGQAIIADLFGPINSARTFSIVIPLVAFSPAVAPILGGLIEEHSTWRNIFLFLAGYGILILILLMTPIIPKIKPNPHTIKTPNNKSAVVDKAIKQDSILRILTNKKFIGFALFMMQANACYFAFLAAAPFLLKKFGYAPSEVGYAFCAASFPYMTASFVGRKLSFKLSYLQIIFIGLLFNLCGSICMLLFATAHWPNIASIMIPVFIITIGNGLLMPFSSASAIALFPQNAGLITGMLATLQLSAASLATFLMGLFANGTLYPLSCFNLTIVFMTLLYFIYVFGFKLRK